LDLKQKHLNAPDWIVVTATERKVRKSRVPKAYEPVLDIFYSFLDECNSKVLYKEETVAAMKAWLNAVEKNNIKISIKDIEFLIKLSPGWAEKRWDTDQVLGSLCDILENDSALLTIESVPDLRKINTTRKAPLGKPYTVRALCDRIYDICDSIFRSPYYTIVLYSKDMYTGGLDSDSEYIYEHVVDYYKLESTLPTSKAPSLISTLREIYNYHLASGLDEISALRSTEEWLDEFYYRTVNKASPVSYRGLHPTQAFYLLHWKERLENRLYIGKEGVIIKTASEEIIPGLPHALLVHKDVHSPLDKTTQLSIEVLRGYFRWEDRPAIDVLDMGCGTGVLSLLAAQLMDAGSITAVDNNEKAIELTRSNIERFGLSERIELKQGDLFENLRGRRFDLIIFNPPGWWSGRYHTTERFLKELHEHLKDGGEARITWPIEFWRSPSEEEPATTEDDLKKLAKQYGLDVETIGREGPYGAYRITVSQETNVQSRTSSGNGIRKTTNSSL
ncbi:MAG: methyltransferase, partial [Candidatus Omnitrophica bacterium]|nr:methyltransferase [Candidatus Omnitrophota bacterium]